MAEFCSSSSRIHSFQFNSSQTRSGLVRAAQRSTDFISSVTIMTFVVVDRKTRSFLGIRYVLSFQRIGCKDGRRGMSTFFLHTVALSLEENSSTVWGCLELVTVGSVSVLRTSWRIRDFFDGQRKIVFALHPKVEVL